MSFKNKAKIAARKTLEAIDKPLKWAQENPVAVERIGLVLVTAFMARSAYKKFAPQNIINVKVKVPELNNYTAAVVNGYKTETGAPVEILRTIAPGFFDDVNDAAYVAHLEVRDLDIEDMNNGNLLGMIFNVKDHYGVKNTPLAVMPYQRVMDHVKEGFPLHEKAEKLLAENGGRSNFISIKEYLHPQD